MESNLRLSNVFRVFATMAAIVAAAPQRSVGAEIPGPPRERILLNAYWRFQKGDPAGVDSKNLLYDVRPVPRALGERVAEFTEAADTLGPATHPILKPYIRVSKAGKYLPFGIVIMIASSLPSLAKWCSSFSRSSRACDRTMLSSFGL